MGNDRPDFDASSGGHYAALLAGGRWGWRRGSGVLSHFCVLLCLAGIALVWLLARQQVSLAGDSFRGVPVHERAVNFIALEESVEWRTLPKEPKLPAIVIAKLVTVFESAD